MKNKQAKIKKAKGGQKKKKQTVIQQPESTQVKRKREPIQIEGKDYYNIEAKLFTQNYTNGRIRKEIAENSALFFILMGMFLVAIILILLSFIRAYLAVLPEFSLIGWLLSVRNDHPLGLVFGITIIIVASVGLGVCGTPTFVRCLFPSFSGKKYSAHEIDEMVNHPETTYLKEIAVYVTPEAAVGLNRGIAVAQYDDIAGIRLKVKHNRQKTTNGSNRGRMSVGRAMYYVLTDHYREWDTYYVVLITKNHGKLVLAEVAYEMDVSRLAQILTEKCPGIELSDEVKATINPQ